MSVVCDMCVCWQRGLSNCQQTQQSRGMDRKHFEESLSQTPTFVHSATCALATDAGELERVVGLEDLRRLQSAHTNGFDR